MSAPNDVARCPAPCGVAKHEAYYWHKTLEHDCAHHKRAKCRVCQTISQLEWMLIEAARCE